VEIRMTKRERFELRLPAAQMQSVKKAAQAGGFAPLPGLDSCLTKA
jgi:hypothetical protein